jgi:serine/threonine protein kinase
VSFQTTVYGKYFLLDRIAVGGMAEVFKAKTYGVRGFERLLVIKRILPHLSKDEEFVEMFIDEAKISVELNHANICQVTDLGKIGDNFFIAMEYIDGKDLRAILKKCSTIKTPLTNEMALFVAMEMLKGLDYAHRKSHSVHGVPLKLIHRDISPQNIMLSYQGEVKIVDFGIAKTESKLNKTQAGVLKGKFGYMSPEQASGLELDGRTDVFSAGIILFEMLTGRRLFLGDTDFETLEKIKECEVPPPSKYNPQIPPELEAAVLKALSRQPEDRFQTAQEFQTALAKIFYSQFSSFSSRDLSDFLHSIFSEEIDQEKESLRRAIDSLPADELEAAISGAEAANDRLIDSSSSGSGRRNATSSSSRPRTGPPIGADKTFGSGTKARTKRATLIRNLAVLLTPALLVVVTLTWLWPSSRKKPKIETSTSASEMVSVQITSDPIGAMVSVQGQKRGTTPLETSLPTGQPLEFLFEKEGFQSRTVSETVTGERTAFGPYVLAKEVPATSTLKITSTPEGAKISINGKLTNLTTPATVENLPVTQTLRVRINLEGYTPQTKTIVLKEDPGPLDFELEPALVTLSLHVNPTNATVFIDGKERGHEILNLPAGKTYTLKVTAPGYEAKTTKITLRNPKELIDISLKAIPVQFGYINIGANPWAKVFVDGAEISETPIVNHKLPIGTHTIEFTNPHFKPVRRKIKIEQGKNPPLLVDFRDSSE